MLRVSRSQVAAFDAIARRAFEAELAGWLRSERGAFVADLPDAELSEVARSIVEQCDALGLIGPEAVRAFAAAATVYGIFAYRDPLFETIFYSALPRGGARLLRSPSGIWARLADVLDREFATRSGDALIVALWQAFGTGQWPEMSAQDLLATYFPERAARLDPDRIARHLTLSGSEADRLGLADARARQVHCAVALLLGARFASDPLYPWAIEAFSGDSDERRQVSRLRAALKVIADGARARQKGGA